MLVAIMIGSALGQSFVAQHGRRRVLPIVVLATILLGLAIGFGLDGELQAIQASSQVHF
jgi:hypothetical protein